ncbi:unnamed protein product [Cyprideis torosa]|uniref:Uncharacterized protein n=1 Tax=Cyprideis torosa TaxID=163714 RepID=A0A7R8W6L5_9CRUS|nr:unnamed protein product [Cyprideis torosa]CAG0882438.1 unnamed protein product [Cyprideis torosa]
MFRLSRPTSDSKSFFLKQLNQVTADETGSSTNEKNRIRYNERIKGQGQQDHRQRWRSTGCCSFEAVTDKNKGDTLHEGHLLTQLSGSNIPVVDEVQHRQTEDTKTPRLIGLLLKHRQSGDP